MPQVRQARGVGHVYILQEKGSNVNAITIAGRIVGKDAVKKEVGAGSLVSFAVSDSKKIKGEWVTTFFDVSLWGSRGDGLLPYLMKGTNVVVVGELQPPVVKGEKCYLSVRAHDVSMMRDKQQVEEDNPF